MQNHLLPGCRSSRSPSQTRIQFRRLPPSIRYVTTIDPAVQYQLTDLARKEHHDGRNLYEVCSSIKSLAGSLGYETSIRVQGVKLEDVASCPDQTEITALIHVNLRYTGV